jgi:hypothetical protein
MNIEINLQDVESLCYFETSIGSNVACGHNPENLDRILMAKKIQNLQNEHIALQPFAAPHSPATHMYDGYVAELQYGTVLCYLCSSQFIP